MKGWISGTGTPEDREQLEALGVHVGAWVALHDHYADCRVDDAAYAKLDLLWGSRTWGLDVLHRTLVYIAGPYAGDVDENVRRAVELGRFAVRIGLDPIVPHVLGAAGIYGAPHEDDDGTCRKAALECGVATAAFIGAGGGVLWIILRDDYSMSDGTQNEEWAYKGKYHVRATWDAWIKIMEGNHWLREKLIPQ